MDERRKHALLFAATILGGAETQQERNQALGIEVAISDAISKAELILEKADERWPGEKVSEWR